MRQLSDENLVESLKRSLAEGRVDRPFEELVRRYERRLFGYCLSRLRSVESARDVTQEVFLVFFRRLREYTPTARLSTFLIGIARNLCMENLRSRRRYEGGEADLLARLVVPAGDRPAERAERAESARRVEAALLSLPDESAEVVELRVFARLPLQEIARLLGRPRTTVRDRFAQAMAELRRRLG